ncbi:MTQ2 [[Candida] subhashii]|uniref:MTQ2 n=1 Tax=[Candida] subhashii TaxID=561895 RepID=A0A8J5UJZ1_9ASCO|nr:MTQ2 [[Candida] subhashii]KAG7664953.1 MTQ2 [[Candida] subhashii]
MLPTPITKDIDYDKVYEPSEDSFLFLDCFEQEADFIRNRFKQKTLPLVTEIGTGSGIVTTFVMKNIIPNSIFLTTDINPHACQTVLETVKANIDQELSVVDSTQMDLTTAIKSQAIDLLIFNPPYVPASELPEIPENSEDPTWLDLALLGGLDGMVTTWRVLNDLDNILAQPDGIAYILFCARNKPDHVANVMRSRGWQVDTVINRKAGWEVLSILRFMKIRNH